MATLADLTLKEFLDQLAARQPTPGGGSASAIGGALGAALASMAANYSVGDEIKEIAATLEVLRTKLLDYADQDVAAYQKYRDTVALPKNTPEEKSVRSKTLIVAREMATSVPEVILHRAYQGLQNVDELSRIGNPKLAGDIASAAYFLEACARGAAMQVFSNCSAKDESGQNAARRKAAEEKVQSCQELREKIHAAVLVMLKIET